MLMKHQKTFVVGILIVVFGLFGSVALADTGHSKSTEKTHHEAGAKTDDHHGNANAEEKTHHEAGAKTDDHHANANADHHGNGSGGGEHSHWGVSPDSTAFAKKMAAIGTFHPVLVHFPIALFIVAALAQILILAGRMSPGSNIVRFLLWCGMFGAVLSALLGWAHSGPPQANEASIMFAHRWIGTSIALGSIVLVFIVEYSQRNKHSTYLGLCTILLFSLALAVAVNGFLGGALAHGGMKHLLSGMG